MIKCPICTQHAEESLHQAQEYQVGRRTYTRWAQKCIFSDEAQHYTCLADESNNAAELYAEKAKYWANRATTPHVHRVRKNKNTP